MSDADSGISFPSYTPIPSIGHELGIIFGFLGFMLLVTFLYWSFWVAGNKRSARKEAERRALLAEKGVRAPRPPATHPTHPSPYMADGKVSPSTSGGNERLKGGVGGERRGFGEEENEEGVSDEMIEEVL